jgi:hypothetical protein
VATEAGPKAGDVTLVGAVGGVGVIAEATYVAVSVLVVVGMSARAVTAVL